jgi:hypothetical protein
MPTRGRLLVAVFTALAGALVLAPPARAAWSRPVAGPVTRGFAVDHHRPFAAGQHRGADFAAEPGTTVRAACAGRVVVARPVGTSGGVVTVACGRWRVSLLPLARIDVREGESAWPGRRLGTAASSREAATATLAVSRGHAGIHLGVRRAGDPAGYVDPLPFLSQPHKPTPGVAARLRRAETRTPPATVAPTPAQVHRAEPPRVAPPATRVAATRPPLARSLAPPLAWAGLAMLMLGAVGAGRVRTRLPRAVGVRVRAAAVGGRLRS